MLNDRYQEFSAAILDAERPIPHGLVGPDGLPSAKRFAVYRNNVVAGLIQALKDAYPAVLKIVGEPFFNALAAAFAIQCPPQSPIMLDYGAGFASFIEMFEPSQSLPYLADVARIERAWVESYHAQDTLPLDVAELAALSPEEFSTLSFVAHPSLRILRSPLPALSVWQMNIEGGVPAVVDMTSGGEDTMILRPHAEVEARLMPPGGAVFLQELVNGANVAKALGHAAAENALFDLAGNLRDLFDAGAFTSWHLAGRT